MCFIVLSSEMKKQVFSSIKPERSCLVSSASASFGLHHSDFSIAKVNFSYTATT